jgi:V/A-type H+-transporting ATPase subunit G/H
VSIEIIKVIREAEEKAEVIKKEATLQAKQIIANANAQALQIIDEAKETSETANSEVLKIAESEGQLLYDDIIKKAAVECENILRKADNNMDDAASIILERIVKASGNS